MASNQMSDRVKDHCRDRIETILKRAIFASPCPLETRASRETLCYFLIDDATVAAYRTLRQAGYTMGYMETELILLHTEGLELALWLHDGISPGPTKVLRSVQNNPLPTQALADACVAAGVKYWDLIRWGQRTAALNDEIKNARTIAHQIINLAQTPGQLTRMVPELKRYLPEEAEATIRVRASPLPRAWAGFPRQDVFRMTATLAKCYLLPAIPSEYSGVDFPEGFILNRPAVERVPYTWATFTTSAKL